MQLIETRISAAAVHTRYANDPDVAKATEWFDFQVPLEPLRAPIGHGEPLGDPETRYLVEVRLAALRYLRDVITEEIQRLSNLAGRTL